MEPATKEQELSMLKGEADMLKAELGNVQGKIVLLEKAEETKS